MSDPTPGWEREWDPVVHALAYEVWRYEKPNEGAEAHARATIGRVLEAAGAAGVRLEVLPLSSDEQVER